MDALKIFLGISLVSLLYDVTSAEKLDIVRYFEVEHVEKKEKRQQFQEMKPAVAEAAAENVIPEPVVTSPKDAVYKLSYAEYEMTWKKFKQDHNRNYKSASEERERFANFMDNVKTIERHNWEFHNGRTTYWMDINQFSDWGYIAQFQVGQKLELQKLRQPNGYFSIYS